MKAQEQIKNDESNLQADTLTDLPVVDVRAERITGGAPGGTPVNGISSNETLVGVSFRP
jgi:hypothetical protein